MTKILCHDGSYAPINKPRVTEHSKVPDVGLYIHAVVTFFISVFMAAVIFAALVGIFTL